MRRTTGPVLEGNHSNAAVVCLGLAQIVCILLAKLQLFTTQSRLSMILRKKPFENIVGKGENAGNQHFLLFPQCFLHFTKQSSFFKSQ